MAQKFTVSVTLTDSAGASASQTFELDLSPPALVITTTSPLPAATIGVAYTETLAASGGVPPYSWALASGSLPPGLSLSASGVISGTPT